MGRQGGAWRSPNCSAIRLLIPGATPEPSSRSTSGLKGIRFSFRTAVYHMLLPWLPKAWKGNYITVLSFFSSKFKQIQTNELLQLFFVSPVIRSAARVYDLHVRTLRQCLLSAFPPVTLRIFTSRHWMCPEQWLDSWVLLFYSMWQFCEMLLCIFCLLFQVLKSVINKLFHCAPKSLSSILTSPTATHLRLCFFSSA